MTELAPPSTRMSRRRHSSVGLLPLHEHPLPSHLPGDISPTGSRGFGSSLYLDPGLRVPGSRVGDGGSRKVGDRGSNVQNGRLGRGVTSADSKVRTAPTDSKIMVVGMAGVGKSALVVRFLTNRFIWEYDPTLEATYKHVTSVDDEPAVMEILDTAGQQDDPAQRESSVRWADGYVLVYAINDRSSFMCLGALKRYLDDVKKTNVQCMLVANKCDLLHERKVQASEGEALAQDMACAFYETSASDGGSDITELFHELHREIKRRKMMETKGSRRRSSAQQVRSVFNRVLNKINNSST